MASSKAREVCERTALFTLTTYPFFNAFSFLMLIAEQARITSEASFVNLVTSLVIYIHVVVMFMCALAMKLGHGTHHVALAHAVQLVLIIYYNMYPGVGPRYTDGLKIRVLSRAVGTVASYLILSSFVGKSAKIQRAGTILFGVFAAGCAYAVHCDLDYRLAFRLVYHVYTVDVVPSIIIHMAAVVGFLVCALAFLNETITRYVALALAAFVIFINLAVDWRLDFWTQRQRADYWCALRIATDNFPILAALILVALSRPNGKTIAENDVRNDEQVKTE
uniref:Transmembrane protein 101 n=1 Tax=Hemiscolopendra marginata TaxID=943146 RepID=A0A646QHX1_9MYRI